MSVLFLLKWHLFWLINHTAHLKMALPSPVFIKWGLAYLKVLLLWWSHTWILSSSPEANLAEQDKTWTTLWTPPLDTAPAVLASHLKKCTEKHKHKTNNYHKVPVWNSEWWKQPPQLLDIWLSSSARWTSDSVWWGRSAVPLPVWLQCSPIIWDVSLSNHCTCSGQSEPCF